LGEDIVGESRESEGVMPAEDIDVHAKARWHEEKVIFAQRRRGR